MKWTGGSREASTVRARLRSVLPRGGALPTDVWRSRHQGILVLLWLHIPLLFVYAVLRGNSWLHGLLEAGAVAVPGAAAHWSRSRRRDSTIFASLGLMTASAVLVHLSGGVIEAHFHFFVMVGVVVLYQDWRPFLLAIAFVVLHHGVMGVLLPQDVYNHEGAWEHPWLWAGIHGSFILAMSAAGIANWRLNERSQSQVAGLAAIVESSNDAIYGWTVDGTITSWNEGAAHLYGYGKDQILGRSHTILVPPERVAEATRQLDTVRRGQRVEAYESEGLSKDGEVVPVSVTTFAVRSPDGAVIGGATIARDITERRRGEQELQQTLSLLSATLESTADGILVVDPEGRISSFNGKFVEMWRLPQAVVASGDDREALRFVVDQLLDPADFIAKVEELYEQPDAESHDTLHFKDGRVFERSSKPQRVGGAVVGRVWSFHDITERTKLEAELAEARDQALETSRLKSDFLATMSHEIRTPMNGVIGLTGLLLDTGLTDVQRKYADGVRVSGEALLGIINDILDFSKIEAGKLELEMVDFELASALDEVAALVAESARGKGLDLVTECLPNVPRTVRGDVGRLRQVLLNLVSNAVKFTSTGEVRLRASLGEVVGPDQVIVRMEVSDTGIGIAPDSAARLFEPFSQADASTTRRYGGTGLGLAICRRLVEAMGGSIGVDSAPGRGSTFSVEVPLGLVSPPVPVPDPPAHALAGRRALIVDDSRTNRLVLAAQLLAWNINADLASDAETALEHLRQAVEKGRPYDLVLVDMAMPGTDGLELSRLVSADPVLSSAHLFLLSSVPVDAEAAADAGVVARLFKPASSSQLYDALVKVAAPSLGESAAPEAAQWPGQGPMGRLLVVEDNAINQAVAKGLAARIGFNCDVAGNGLEALAAISRRRYDAILMDCQMPEMDGFEATAEIRRREAGGPHMPIIAMTAGALVEDRERCLDAGMDDYLAKPVKGGELERVLKRWLPARGSRSVGAGQ